MLKQKPTGDPVKAFVEVWIPYEPGYEAQFERGNSEYLDEALRIVLTNGEWSNGWMTPCKWEVIDDTCQGHELYRVDFYDSPPVFIGGGNSGFLPVNRYIQRHGRVGKYGDERSIVRGRLKSINPDTKMGLIQIINVDRCVLQPPLEVEELVLQPDTAWKLGN